MKYPNRIAEIEKIIISYQQGKIDPIVAIEEIARILDIGKSEYELDWQNDSCCFYREK